ncbi:hypothetical protein ACIOD2_08145 [Amycolatopsis sp. NPDC088138]|uniref:hypothetical protein n=1 Tax=Amycolatopsis sp. NPDC088138 TaxID=3363938 RepID=UPI003823B855
MASDRPKPPPGMLPAALVLLAAAVGGAVLAFAHTSVLNLILGIALFAGGGFLGVVFLYAWFKGRK